MIFTCFIIMCVEHSVCCSALLVARRGRRRRRYRWAAGSGARGARRGAAPCSETTRAPGRPTVESGTGTTGCETRHTGRHRSRTARRTEPPATRGESRACSMPVSAHSPSDSSSTLSAPATRERTQWASRLRRYGSWGHRSSSLDSRAVCYVYVSAYLRSLAVDDGPTTRRTEDCPVAGRARRCRWRAAGAARGRAARAPAPRSARPRAASTPPPATCPASPAARRTSACAGIAPPPCTLRLYIRCSRSKARVKRRCIKADHTRALCSEADPGTAAARRRARQAARVPARARRASRPRARCLWPPPPCKWWRARPPAARRRATCRSPAALTASSSCPPHNYAPNPQAINVAAIPPFINTNSPDDVTISTRYRLCDSVRL
ncbi:uncharacterized protein LOC142975032 isoform X3 [Anticarsia gemmatalis]|uniref:uncharacterized protein LOC142975032 isoform X3 n=1 Tax=Anticarsia gemmatalis TaxID=129554 RepID=UPI003F75EB6E